MPNISVNSCCDEPFCPMYLRPANCNNSESQETNCCSNQGRFLTKDFIALLKDFSNLRNTYKRRKEKNKEWKAEHFSHKSDYEGSKCSARFPYMFCGTAKWK